MHPLQVPGALYECNQNYYIKKHMMEEIQSFAQRPYNTVQTQDITVVQVLLSNAK